MSLPNHIDYVEKIKQNVSIRDFIDRAGIKFERHGYIKCPFHGEKTASLRIYPDDRGWYCFGCGLGGDVLNFAQRWYNLPFVDTLKAIDHDFNLGLNFGQKMTPEEHAKLAVEKAIKKAERSKKEREAAEKERTYWKYFDMFLELQKVISDLEPKTKTEEWKPEWASAVLEMQYVAYMLEEAEADWRSVNAK